jgi:hypothetical protein
MVYKFIISVLFLSLLAACAPEMIASPTIAGPANPSSSTPGAPGAYPVPTTQQGATLPKNVVSYPPPLPTIPNEAKMIRGQAFVDKSDLVSPKSSSEQFVLHVSGSLPTPCNLLQTSLKAPDEQNRIQVEVYSLLPPDKVCAQVLVPFDTTILLGSLKSGKYTVILNGQPVGELTVQ